ncbi:hypothetical protein [Mycolicibacterium sp. XJ870]
MTPDRLRLRRRLLVFSAPVAVVLLLAIAKCISVVVAGNSVVSDFADRDSAAMGGDIAMLRVFNVIEPARAYYADGARAVLENRLPEADRHFSEALARTDSGESCPVRVNLALVREALGDTAAAVFDNETAAARYIAARTVVEQAPDGCFAGNTDPDPERRAVRNDALARLDGKLDAVRVAPPPPPPPPPAAVPPPTAPPPSGGARSTESEARLDPGAGDPLDRLQEILRDAAAVP